MTDRTLRLNVDSTLAVQGYRAARKEAEAYAGAARKATGETEKQPNAYDKLKNSLFTTRNAYAALTTGGVGLVIKKLFESGSAAEETASKYNTVFGPATDDLTRSLGDFGTMLGLSRVELEDAAATTGAIVQGMGATKAASAALTEEIIRLSGDLTSFNNIPVRDTLWAIQAAITGEREQLKKLG